MHWSEWHWGFGFGHWLFGVVFWLLVVGAIIALFRFCSSPGDRKRERTARDVLEERYARDEIDRDEFERKRRELDHG